MFDAARQNLKLALRSLAKSPAFTVVVLGTLAIGIGANSAIFSVVYGMLLRPFPYPEPDRLVRVHSYPLKNPSNTFSVSVADVDDFRRDSRLIASVGAYSESRVNLLTAGGAHPVQMASVTPELLPTVGVPPLLGRNFTADEDRPGGDVNKAILSHSLWKSRYGGDPNIVGKTIRTAMNTYTVVGVMPEGFAYPGRTDLWVTVQSGLALRKENRYFERRRAHRVVARLKPGVTEAQAQTELAAMSARIRGMFPKINGELSHRIENLREHETKRLRPYLLLLSAAVGLVLAICCANVANLMLARSSVRVREFTLFAALGANRARLLGVLLAESLLLSSAGGAAGLALAFFLVRALPSLIPEELPVWMRVEVDPAVLAFTALVSLGTGILFGLVPALHATRVNLSDALKEGARGSARSGWLRRSLVVAEVALSLVLLVAAGLLVKSFNKLMQVDPGFEPESVVTVAMSPYRPGTNEQRIDQVCLYYREVIRRLEELPGVIAVGGTDNFPFTGQRTERTSLTIEIKGNSQQETQVRAPAVFVDVTPRYFEAMSVPLLEGRAFTEADRRTAPLVIILSERAAKTLFPGRSALGNQVRAGTPGYMDPWATVVGVAGNVKYRSKDDGRDIEFYYPYTQYGLGSAHLAVRVQGDGRALEGTIRATVSAVDEIETMRGLIDNSLWQERLWSLLLAAFAAVALLLAVIGLYGVISYGVARRTREIGIRAALGAAPLGILSMITVEGLRLVAIGLAFGAAVAWAATRALRSLLYGVTASEPATLLAVPAILIAAATLACLIPAFRAARLNPVSALRQE